MKFKRVNIEISNVCNLSCSFCPKLERADQFMSVEQFGQIIDQVAPIADEVCLHLMGEPLMHPKLAEFFELAAIAGSRINLTSNGLLLTGARRDLILSDVVRQVNFSVHSFFDNFPGKDWREYLARLIEFAKQAQRDRPDLYINFRLWDATDPKLLTSQSSEALAFLLQALGSAEDISEINLRRKKGYRLLGRTYVNFDSRFVWPSPTLPFRSKHGTCKGLRDHFGIHADGTVVPCCLDKEGVLALGNIFATPLSNILNGHRAQNMREGFTNFELREDLCQKCDFVSRFRKKSVIRGRSTGPELLPI